MGVTEGAAEVATDAATGSAPGRKLSPLQALTLAAMALPNLMAVSAQAAEVEESHFQSSHYAQGDRPFWSGPQGTARRPESLSADSLQAGFKLRLTDRVKLAVDFLQDTWSGATPYMSAPEGYVTVTGASAYPPDNGWADKNTGAPLVNKVPKPQLINLMTSASPETRKQARFTLTHDWNNASVDVGAGLSDEPDFKSKTLNVGGRWDFNARRTTLSAALSRTSSHIAAKLGPVNEYTTYSMYADPAGNPNVSTVDAPGTPGPTIATRVFNGKRQDWTADLGLTQVLDKNTTASTGLSWVRSSGFLEDPYKLTLLAFVNKNLALPQGNPVNLFSVPEKRPDTRNQGAWTAHLAHYFSAPDAALHLDYRYARDNWGIEAHTGELSWVQGLGDSWMITPRFRYYQQSAASFYQPYFQFNQTQTKGRLNFSKIPIEYWSSDHRLSSYTGRSVGLIVSKQLDKGVSLELGWERYVHDGTLTVNSSGASYQDRYASNLVNLGLKIDFLDTASSGDEHAHHHHGGDVDHAGHGGAPAPAGVMFAHLMNSAGAWMIGYDHMTMRQAGRMLHGSVPPTDAAIVDACGTLGCVVTPTDMSMHMNMLHLMYAPTDNINVMLMPQWVDMTMHNRSLDGGFYTPIGAHSHDMELAGHSTGGPGDTTAAVLVQLWRSDAAELHLGLGVSVPTGAVDLKMVNHGGDYMDYGMQLGSGTWDALPSLTYTAQAGRWHWGGQLSATKRLQDSNQSGYALGDTGQATAWFGYKLTDWFSASLRGVRTVQGGIRGQLAGVSPVIDASGQTTYPRPQESPVDLAANYGGRVTEVGLGFSVAVPGRATQGDRISIEWLKPVDQDLKGFQLERASSLSFSWNMML